MFKKFFILYVFFLTACQNEKQGISYDIVLIAGQSNTHQGFGLDTNLDCSNPKIMQMCTKGKQNFKIISAKEPLQHYTSLQFNIGFGLSFAKSYLEKYAADDRKILLIPCGYGCTGFSGKFWNKGDTLYNDAVKRVKFALSLNAENKLVAILWHQGESDIDVPEYKNALDSMIVNMRKDISGNQSVPFLLGGMVPYWVNKNEGRKKTQTIIANTPKRIKNTAFVSPYYPFVIKKVNDSIVDVHYDAAGQRILGKRYFAVYDSLNKSK